jgi:hypothetical protein
MEMLHSKSSKEKNVTKSSEFGENFLPRHKKRVGKVTSFIK